MSATRMSMVQSRLYRMRIDRATRGLSVGKHWTRCRLLGGSGHRKVERESGTLGDRAPRWVADRRIARIKYGRSQPGNRFGAYPAKSILVEQWMAVVAMCAAMGDEQ